MKKDNTTPYVVMSTAFGHKSQQISAPMDKDSADALADKIKEAMDGIDGDFKVFDNIKVQKYEADPVGYKPEKNNPYNYSVLDGLDKQIKKG